MKMQNTTSHIRLWLSETDTYNWAHRPGCVWPGSQLSGTRLYAEFDANGLVEMLIDGKPGDCDVNEFNAITSDHLSGRLSPKHLAYFVTVGQFRHSIKAV